MFLFSKKDIIKKVILASLSVCLVVVAIIAAVRQIQNHVTAVTSEGTAVNVVKGESIKYGSWGTGRFTITINGRSTLGFCANPKKKPPIGDFTATIMPESNSNNLIKLMIYISTADNAITRPIMDDFFPTITDDDLRYAYSHAVIGAIYDGDYKGLDTSDRNMVDGIVSKLQTKINNNADVWIVAKNYRLYGIDRSGTSAAGDDYQDVLWAENNYTYGNIKVEKHDSETGSTTPQGGASLQGITFEVHNNSGSRIYNPNTNQFYDDGALVASGTTNANGVVTFSNLVTGAYTVRETGTNSSYDLTATSSQNVTLSVSGRTETVVFNNNVKKGSLTVYKKDKELNSCNQLGKAKFTGIKFQVINNSTNPIYYGGNSIAVGNVVAEKTLGATDCSASFNNLPYGSYQVKEVGSGVGYLANSTVYDVVIPSGSSTSLSVTIENQVIRGDVKFRKVDQNNKPMANVPFRITSETTNESHIVITDANGVVDTSANPHSNHTNGYDSITNFNGITYQGYGTWFGKSASSSDVAPVTNSLGALPYDTYEISEVVCDQNRFCYDIESEKQTFEITTNSTVVDLGNWENNCAEFSLATTAEDNADGDKFITAKSSARIKDTINYCLKANTQFTIKGTLMDKQTNQALKNSNGQVIEQFITVTPTADCGVAEMVFEFDASSLAGHEVVVFEKAYYNNAIVATHENINDAAQTINIVSLSTTATDNVDGDKYVAANSGSKIKDVVNYCLKAGTQFTIKGILMDKATGEALKINNQTIEKSVSITPTSNCGSTEIVFDLNSTSLTGKEIVVFETAIYNNKTIVAHEDINDAAQSVNIIKLSTTAVDNADNDKFVIADPQSKIKDTINYCLKAGTEYTIEGTLMDKASEAPITGANGQPIKKTVTVTPTSNCGNVTVEFTIDTSSLAGHEVVVYESAYYNNVEIVAHANSEDESQTVSIISLATTAVDGQVIEKPEADNDETENDDDENKEGDDSENENEEEDDEDESTLDNEVAAKYVENTKDAKIKDTIAYCLKTDVEFTIIGTLWDKTAKEELKIDGQVIEKSITVKPTKACGEVEMVFELDASLLGGHEIVVFEKLYYNQDLIMKHEEPEDEAQTVRIISLTTFATHAESDSKDIIASGRVRIKDEVKYCLKPNTKYTFKGTLMNKNTGKKLLIDGKPITQTVTFTTEDDCCGQFDMFYEFDATDLGGTDVVIFEDLYEGDDLIIRHNDPENQDETFYLTIPVPDTGFATLVVEKSDQKNPPVLVIAISVCVATMVIYLGIRFRTRKKYFTVEF